MEQIDYCLCSVESFRFIFIYIWKLFLKKKYTTNKWHRHKSQKGNLAKAKQKKVNYIFWDINCYASCLPYSILRYEYQITAKQMQILSISKNQDLWNEAL